jgi:hypothetical protein
MLPICWRRLRRGRLHGRIPGLHLHRRAEHRPRLLRHHAGPGRSGVAAACMHATSRGNASTQGTLTTSQPLPLAADPCPPSPAQARQFYTFAKTYLGFYSDAIPDAQAFYRRAPRPRTHAPCHLACMHSRCSNGRSNNRRLCPCSTAAGPAATLTTWPGPPAGCTSAPARRATCPTRAATPPPPAPTTGEPRVQGRVLSCTVVGAGAVSQRRFRLLNATCNPPLCFRFVWDTMHPGVALLFATRISPGDAGRQATMRQILDTWVDGTSGITKTPKVDPRCRGGPLSAVLPAALHGTREVPTAHFAGTIRP